MLMNVGTWVSGYNDNTSLGIIVALIAPFAWVVWSKCPVNSDGGTIKITGGSTLHSRCLAGRIIIKV